MMTQFDDKKMDELLSRAFGRDEPEFDFEQWQHQRQKDIEQFQLQLQRADITKPARHKLWRTIMKRKLTRYAAAAVLIFAIGTGIVGILSNGATPAWAIEQTLEAVSKVESVYFSGKLIYNENAFDFESWSRVHENRLRSGDCRMNLGEGQIHLSVEKDNKTYRYDSVKNTVVVEDGLNVQIAIWINDDFIQRLKSLGNWNEEFGQDDETGKDCVFITCSKPSQPASWWVQIDLESKLPIRGKQWKNANCEGQPEIDVDAIVYNPQLPEGIFEFDIPEDAEVIDQCMKNN